MKKNIKIHLKNNMNKHQTFPGFSDKTKKNLTHTHTHVLMTFVNNEK